MVVFVWHAPAPGHQGAQTSLGSVGGSARKRAVATEPDNLSFITGAHPMQERPDPHRWSSDFQVHTAISWMLLCVALKS